MSSAIPEPESDREGSSTSVLATAVAVAAVAASLAILPRLFRGHAAPTGDAPDFTAALVANAEPGATEVSLAALRGRPVVLDFWATWCGPCQAEAPIVDQVAERYKERGLVVVGVNTSDEEGLAEAWVRKKGVRFPIAYDRGNKVASAFGVHNIPTLVVIDKEGRIRAVRTGMTSASELERLVREVL